jgi:hypothetical protein
LVFETVRKLMPLFDRWQDKVNYLLVTN